MKKSLCQTNPYLRDPQKREAMLAWNAYESAVLEGAQGLKPEIIQRINIKAASSASRKKSVKAE